MNHAWVDRFDTLSLGSPQKESGDAKAVQTNFFIRLVCPPFAFSEQQQKALWMKAQEEECQWERIPDVTKDDSFLGQIELHGLDGCGRYMREILYVQQEEYAFWRVKDKNLQGFKKLYYNPARYQEMELKLDSIEFIPFRQGMGFLSICFLARASENVPFRFVIDSNYYLPFVDNRAIALIQRRKVQKDRWEEKEFYVADLLQDAYQSLMVERKIEDCNGNKVISVAGNRLFLMSYAVLAVNNEKWQEDTVKEARHFYHQTTRWSRDSYKHDIALEIEWEGPEKTSSGVATRFYAMNSQGITCMGLGASEFEQNNYLPKFRESNFFALLLAWHIKTGLKNLDKQSTPKPWFNAIQSILSVSLFKQKPRQQFFEACLKFFQVGKDLPGKEIEQVGLQIEEKEDPEDYVFKKSGDYWTLAYKGEKKEVKDSKGMGYIAYLIRNRNKKIHVIELNKSEKGKNSIRERDAIEEGLGYSNSHHAPSDHQAREEYKKRLLELSEERKEAEKDHDWSKLEKIDEETEKIGKCSKAKFCSSPENDKLRKSVSNAIERALKNIEKHLPSLAKHLENAIQRGTICIYQPDEEIFWDVPY
ncbi:MAG: hypothetical protein HUU50_03170 [Candidatus Brocadiae bacterium]|nr:hypothetical protein [Candidatus Brocadiia bacterium]